MTSKEQVVAVVELITAVGDIIREAGPAGLPSGHLYAMLMAKGISYNGYQQMIGAMQSAGVVKQSNNVLYWTGPAKLVEPTKV